MHQTLKKNSSLMDLFAIIILALVNFLKKQQLSEIGLKTICKIETF